MHACLKSACAVLAWSILVVLVAAGMKGSVSPAQANIRTASNTAQVTLAATLSVAAAPKKVARPVSRYAVRPGDTLSGIAARLGVRGGWQALYAANRHVIGPDPDVIRPGTVLVLPGQRAPARYRVVPGDTLAAITVMLAVRGGWPTLYAANRRVIGPNPDLIRPGAVLTVPQPSAPSPAAPRPPGRPTPSAPAPGGSGHRPLPGRTGPPPAAGTPQWQEALLLAVGLVTGAVFLAGLVLVVHRRRQQAASRAARPGNTDADRGRGGRFPGVAAALRAVTVAARVHPAGVAVPSAVLATGIVLFTVVESATNRVVPPPGGSGPGLVSVARLGAGQPHHRLQPGPPGQPAPPVSPGPIAQDLACGPPQIAPPLSVPVAAPPAGAGLGPQACLYLSSSRPGGGLACDASQVPSPATPARSGRAGQ